MSTVKVYDDAHEKISKDFDEKWKPAILAAIEEAGGSLFIRINCSTVVAYGRDGSKQSLEGLGKYHEFNAAMVESDSFPPSFGKTLYDYLTIAAWNLEHSDDPRALRKYPQVKLNTGFPVNVIDIFDREQFTAELTKLTVFSQHSIPIGTGGAHGPMIVGTRDGVPAKTRIG